MPTLIVEQPDKRTGGPIRGRVLIGRLPTNGIVVNESTVSRLHAWIDRDLDGNYYVGDGGSLGGTQVNGRAVNRRKILEDGDVVKVGRTHVVFSTEEDLPPGVTPTNLAGKPPSTFVEVAGVLFDCRCGAPVWFKAGAIGQAHVCRHCSRTIIIPGESGVIAETMPSAEVIEPGMPPAKPKRTLPVPKPHVPPVEETPAEEWAKKPIETATATEELAQEELRADEPTHGEGLAELQEPAADQTARNGDVAHDPEVFDAFGFEPAADTAGSATVALEPEANPSPADSAIVSIDSLAAAPEADTCSICHTPLTAGEPTTACPSCGLTFHAECWKENLGCSAYGCNQVGVLKPPEPEGYPIDPLADDDLEADAGFPWEFVFVVLSVGGSLLGALAYGVPAIIGALGTAIYLLFFKPPASRRSIAIVALVVCLLGAAGGVYLSYLWWNGWPVGHAPPRGGRS